MATTGTGSLSATGSEWAVGTGSELVLQRKERRALVPVRGRRPGPARVSVLLVV